MLWGNLFLLPVRSPFLEYPGADTMAAVNQGILLLAHTWMSFSHHTFHQGSHIGKCSSCNCASCIKLAVTCPLCGQVISSLSARTTAQLFVWATTNTYCRYLFVHYLPAGKITPSFDWFFRCIAVQCIFAGQKLPSVHSTVVSAAAHTWPLPLHSSVCGSIRPGRKNEHCCYYCFKNGYSFS